MALFGGLFGGSDPKPPTQTVTRIQDPNALEIQQLALPGIRSFAEQQLSQYPGQTYAGFDPTQTQAQEMALGAAGTQGTIAGQAANQYGFLTGGDIWNPSINPQIQRTIDAAVRPTYENLTQSVLPAVRSGAIQQGGFGGSRQGIAEGMAIQGAQREAGDIAAKIPTDLYKTNLQAQLSALGLTPTVQQAQVAPAATTGAVGDVRQGMTQQQIDEAMGRYNFGQYGDLLKSRELLGLASAFPDTGAVTTGSIAPGPSTGSKALGGALAGAQLGSVIPGIGTGVGAIGGALMPFLFS